MSGVVISGASVTRVRPPRREVSSPIAPSSRPRSFAGSCTPLRATFRNGPSMWMPSTPGTRASIAARTASSARATMCRSSLMSVGRNPVVPKRRCAWPISRMASTVGSALKSTPPPPFTWVSRKPGISRWPLRSWRTALRHRASSSATTSTIRLPSSSTARSSRMPVSPSTRPLTSATAIRLSRSPCAGAAGDPGRGHARLRARSRADRSSGSSAAARSPRARAASAARVRPGPADPASRTSAPTWLNSRASASTPSRVSSCCANARIGNPAAHERHRTVAQLPRH